MKYIDKVVSGKVIMPPVSQAEKIRAEVNILLEQFFDGRITESSDISLQYGRLWRVMSNLSRAGGKRLRPYLVVSAYRWFGGGDYRKIMPVAVAWELLHLSMLIHDDIIDNDLVRYGVANVAGSYRAIYEDTPADSDRQAHLSNAAAIIAGDLALSAAHELILDCDMPALAKIRAHSYLTKAVVGVAGGQLLDTEASLYTIMEADPLLVARQKTASYTYVGPLKTGAALAGATETELEVIERLGNALGCAYQLQDDLLGVFGDSTVTGKSAIGDISEGKRTFLMQQTLLGVGPKDLDTLQSLVGKADLSSAEAERVRSIILKTGARQQTEDLIKQYLDEAHVIAGQLQVTDAFRAEINAFITLSVERKR